MGSRKDSAQKQQLLLDEGLQLLWERGYNGVSVRDIVEAAKVPKGSFYFYFDSKEDFVTQAIHAYVRKSAFAESPVDGTAVQRIRKLMEFRRNSLTPDSCQRGCLMMNLSAEVGVSHPEIRDLIQQYWNNMSSPLQEWVEEALDKGEVTSPLSAEALTDAIEMTWRGAVATAKSAQDPRKLDLAMEFIFDQVLQA